MRRAARSPRSTRSELHAESQEAAPPDRLLGSEIGIAAADVLQREGKLGAAASEREPARQAQVGAMIGRHDQSSARRIPVHRAGKGMAGAGRPALGQRPVGEQVGALRGNGRRGKWQLDLKQVAGRAPQAVTVDVEVGVVEPQPFVERWAIDQAQLGTANAGLAGVGDTWARRDRQTPSRRRPAQRRPCPVR